ncbi:MAG: four helix bundle protein [Terriglobales bacterium]
MDNYRDLIAWQKGKDLALAIYACTREFPKSEVYGLASQMRRAAVSVPSNIAEGKGRYSSREFVQFLLHARGSLLELETQILIAHELAYIDSLTFRKIESDAAEVGGILNGLIHRFQTRDKRLT